MKREFIVISFFMEIFTIECRPSHTDGCSTIWAFAWTVARKVLMPRLLPSPHLGSNFIDFGLGVVVQGAARTLMAFKPEHLHATSYQGSVFSVGLAMNSTAWVEQALLELQQRGGLVEFGLKTVHDLQEVD